jgi:hypothetical protein
VNYNSLNWKQTGYSFALISLPVSIIDVRIDQYEPGNSNNIWRTCLSKQQEFICILFSCVRKNWVQQKKNDRKKEGKMLVIKRTMLSRHNSNQTAHLERRQDIFFLCFLYFLQRWQLSVFILDLERQHTEFQNLIELENTIRE